MTNQLYWTMTGVGNYVHKHIAVTGEKFTHDLLDLDMFTYSNDKEAFIVLTEKGISLFRGETLEEAIKEMDETLEKQGVHKILEKIKIQAKTIPNIPTKAPTFEGEKIELDVYINIQTGEESISHTNWIKSFNKKKNKTA